VGASTLDTLVLPAHMKRDSISRAYPAGTVGSVAAAAQYRAHLVQYLCCLIIMHLCMSFPLSLVDSSCEVSHRIVYERESFRF
jgi:hypothetical protein